MSQFISFVSYQQVYQQQVDRGAALWHKDCLKRAQFLASTSEQKGQVNRFIWNIHRWKAAQREIKDDKESNQPNEKQTTNPVTHAGMRSPLRGTLTSPDT